MQPTDREIDTLRQNTRIMVRELGLLREAYFAIGVTLAMRHLLIEMRRHPGATVNEIAEHLLLEKSSASRLIQKAAQRGFVRYSSDTKDKRRRSLQLTELGGKTLEDFERIAQQQVRDALASLDPNEVEIVVQGMSYFAKGLQKARHKKEERNEIK